MNERFKELAKQAGIYNLDLSDETEYWILEKFAELIVLECSSILDKDWMTHHSKLLLEHFGVSEDD